MSYVNHSLLKFRTERAQLGVEWGKGEIILDIGILCLSTAGLHTGEVHDSKLST